MPNTQQGLHKGTSGYDPTVPGVFPVVNVMEPRARTSLLPQKGLKRLQRCWPGYQVQDLSRVPQVFLNENILL